MLNTNIYDPGKNKKLWNYIKYIWPFNRQEGK